MNGNSINVIARRCDQLTFGLLFAWQAIEHAKQTPAYKNRLKALALQRQASASQGGKQKKGREQVRGTGRHKTYTPPLSPPTNK